MKDTALVIMAAGIGSRFGGGIKQLEPVGPSGEIDVYKRQQRKCARSCGRGKDSAPCEHDGVFYFV